MSEIIQFRVDPPAASIFLDRQQRHNALDQATVSELIQLLTDCHSERRVRAVILSGAGDSFCSGTDLHELQTSFNDGQNLQTMQSWHQQSQSFLELIELMLRFPKPIIVGANGPVIGSGLSLLLAADFIVANESTFLQSPESLRGLSTGLTGPLLSFRSSTSLANRMLLTGDKLSAADAVKMGLVHETVPADFVWARCFEVAKLCAKGARESHQMTKQMINETIGEELSTQLSIGAANLAAARVTDAAKEGVSAFLEKRDPEWD